MHGTETPAERRLSYAPEASTRPGDERWTPPPGFRAYERTVPVGRRQACWEWAAGELLRWGVKTRSGFHVVPDAGAGFRVGLGASYWLVASIGPWRVREPARVVAVVDRPDRCGFAYGTLEGHPVSGEEAFILSRTSDDDVLLTLRSLTRAAPSGPWRVVFPLLLVAQRCYRRRYVRALQQTAG